MNALKELVALLRQSPKLSIVEFLAFILVITSICFLLTTNTSSGGLDNQAKEEPKLFLEPSNLTVKGYLIVDNYTIEKQGIILSNASLIVPTSDIPLEELWMDLPISSGMLTNATLYLDSNFSLKNCSIFLPELHIRLKDGLNIEPEYNKTASIDKLNNENLSVVGIELHVYDTSIPLGQESYQVPEASLFVPKDLQLKDINLSLKWAANKTNTSIVDGILPLNESYIYIIRNSSIRLPPGAMVIENPFWQQQNATFNNFIAKNVEPIETILSSVLRYLALIAAIVFLSFLLIRVVEFWRRSPSLVLNNFGITSYTDIDKNLEGLSQLTKENLGIRLEIIQRTIEKHKKESEISKYKVREFCPLPNNKMKKGVSDLVSSMKDAKLEKSLPILSIIDLSAVANFLFPPRGIEVSCFLQSKGKNQDMLGISFKMTDIGERQEARSFTYWEKRTTLLKFEPDNKVKIDKINKIVDFFKNIGEFKSAKTYQDELLGLYTQEQIIENRSKIEDIDKKINKQEIGNRLFSLGTKCKAEKKDSKAIDEVIDLYLKALSEANPTATVNNRIKRKWKNIITEPIEYPEDFIDVAQEYWKADLQNVAIEMLNDAEKLYPKDKVANISFKLKTMKNDKADQLYYAARELTDLGRHKEAKDLIKQILDLASDHKNAIELAKKIDDAVVEETFQERYIKLLKPATFYLASEIHRFWMLEQLCPWYYDFFNINANKDKASVYNFFGALYTSAGIYDPIWFDLAKEDLERACKYWKDWYLPHENLGFLYSIKGQKSDDNNTRIILEGKAIVEYNKALTEIKKALTEIKMPTTFIEGIDVIPSYTGETGEDLEIIEKRINLGMAIAYYNMNEFDKAKTEVKKIDDWDFNRDKISDDEINRINNTILIASSYIEGQLDLHALLDDFSDILPFDINLWLLSVPAPNGQPFTNFINFDMSQNISKFAYDFIKEAYIFREAYRKKEKGINPIQDVTKEIPRYLEKYKSARLMYNLACYYALANKSYLEPKLARERSRLFLAMSLAKDKKDENLWNLADKDPDLSEVRDKLPDLKFHLSYEMAAYNDELPKDNDIADLFLKVFKASKWID